MSAEPEMLRRPHWEVALAAEVEAADGRAFAWGTHDCVCWAARVVAAISPRPLPPTGGYATESGALRALLRMGFSDLPAAVDSVLPRLPGPLLACRGDVVLGADGALGICVGARAAFVAAEGLAWRPLRGCAAAWRV